VAAARALARGLRAGLPGARCDLMPVADGGDGLIDVLLARRGGRRVRLFVTGPLGERRRADYALLDDGETAVVEMARASGIAGLRRLDPLGATSYGTGELVADALRRGRSRVLIGLGGSASSDGGAGMVQALGARLLDADGRGVEPGAAGLAGLRAVDVRELRARLRGIEVVGISDVTNPLLGPQGSARVFGPQKGATAAMVDAIERALGVYARAVPGGLRAARLTGAGAAGGMGFSVAALLGGRLVSGARWVLGELGASARLERADYLVTGEGRIDASSFFGKAPLELARLARRRGVPSLLVAGQLEPAVAGRLSRLGVGAVEILSRPGEKPERSMRLVRPRLARAARELARAAAACLLLAGAARAGDFAEIDRLYWNRHQGDNLARSVALLEARLKAEPKDAEALWRLGRSLVRVGERQSSKKDKLAAFARAQASAERAVELAPRDAEANFIVGLAMGRLGQTRGIMRSLFMVGPMKKRMRTVLELDPRHAGAHHVLGEMLRQLPAFAGGSKAGAVRELEEAVRLEPAGTSHYPALAQAYVDAGRRDKAAETLQACVKISAPADPADAADDLQECRDTLRRLKR
jgi:glycerate kinase